MTKLAGLAIVVTIGVGISGCEKKTRGGASQARDTTSQLWALAPTGSPAGGVIGDGVPARALEISLAVWNLIGARPWAKPYLEQARAEVLKDAPFDVFDPAAWKTAGFDLSKGGAVFAAEDGREPALLVVPVGDRAAFVKTVKGQSEKQNGRDVDRIDDVLCATAGGRYLCARTLDAIDAAVKPHDSPLAARMKALPKEARGDLELYADLKKLKPNDRDMPDEMWGSMRLGDDGAAVHLWMKGPQLAPAMLAFGAGDVAGDVRQHTGRASFVLRSRLNMSALASQVPPMAPVGAIDVKKDVVEQLTGDFQLVSTSEGKLGIMLMLGLKDAGPPQQALQHACELGRAAIASDGTKGVTLEWAANACKADVDPAALGVPGLDKLKVRAAVEGKLATIAVGDVDLKAFAGTADADAGSPEAKDVLGKPWAWALWMRGFDFASGLSPSMTAMINGAGTEAGQALDMASWLGAHLYEIAMGARFENDVMVLLFRVTTVGGDPPEVRKAYGAALEKRFAGDAAGWQSAIGEIQKKHPDSLAARMGASSAGTAFIVGTLAAIGVASAQKYVERSQMAVPDLPPP